MKIANKTSSVSFKIFTLLLALLYFFDSASLQTRKCHTPDKNSGVCVPLKLCEPLYKLRYKASPTHEDRIFLSLSLCEHKTTDPIVCCSNYTTPTSLKNSVNKPLDLLVEKSLPHVSECSASHEQRIFGGEEVKIDEFPFSALLVYVSSVSRGSKVPEYSYNCGGSLISHRFVLTAAHCVSPNILRSVLRHHELKGVRLGEHNLKTNPDCGEGVTEDFLCAPNVLDVDIEKLIIHEKFVRDQNDLALIKLAQHVDFNDFIKPICLPSSGEFKETDNLNFIVTGFGRTETKSFSEVKLKTNVGAVNNQECQKIFSSQPTRRPFTVVESQICAVGVETQDSCNGDSGNGLIYVNTKSTHAHWVILGITSFGPIRCGSSIPGIYTRVTSFIPWINEHLSKG